MKRAERRHQLDRIKQKAIKIIKGYQIDLTNRRIGKTAAVHGVACSCSMCGNPRRHAKGKDTYTLQEKRNKLKIKDID